MKKLISNEHSMNSKEIVALSMLTSLLEGVYSEQLGIKGLSLGMMTLM